MDSPREARDGSVVAESGRSMNRRKENKSECYLCGGVATTRDHIPPLGLFPAPRPHNLITVPACDSCNRGNSLHDEYFRVTVATGSRDSPQSIALLHQRILPRMRRSPALIAELMKSMRWTDVRSQGGVYLGRAPAFPIDRPRIQTVIEKIVKGLYFKHKKRRLPADQVVDRYLYNPPIENPFQEEIVKVPLHNVGDGTVFSYRYCMGDGPDFLSYWFLMFYNDTTFFIVQTSPASNPQVNSDAAPASSAAPVT